MKTLAFLCILFFIGPAQASIVYQVDRKIGIGSVKGSITTDGTLGRLPANCDNDYFGCASGSPFIGWNLAIDDGVYTFNLTDENSFLWAWSGDFEFVNTNFYATRSNLVFDFDSAGVALFEWDQIGHGNPLWQLAGANSDSELGSELVSAEPSTTSAAGPRMTRSGEVVIGWASTWDVPASNSLVLMVIGLAGISVSRKYRGR